MADLALSTPPGANGTSHALSRALLSALMELGRVITAHQDGNDPDLEPRERLRCRQSRSDAWARFDAHLQDTLSMVPRSVEDRAALRLAKVFAVQAAAMLRGDVRAMRAALAYARAGSDVGASRRVKRITDIGWRMLAEMAQLPISDFVTTELNMARGETRRILQDRPVLHA